MNLTRILSAAAILLAVSLNAHAQIPVTVTTQASDSPMTMAEFSANMTRWGTQVQQMTSQIEQMKRQYDAITGIRNLGDVLNNPALRNYLGDDWQKSYDDLGKGYNGLSASAKSIYDKYKVFDRCSSMTNAANKASCYSRSMRAANDKATWSKAFDSAKSRISQIEGLMAKINTTSDAKAIAELQGRIQAEQALVTNQQTMLTLQKQIVEAEREIMADQERQEMARLLKRPAPQISPITFD